MAKARRPRKRAMGRYIRGTVDTKFSLTTLAATTAVKQDFDNVVNERTLVSSIVATYSLENLTPAAADGPIMVGLAHSDYTVAEIEAVIEATGSWNEGDKVAQEIAKRQVRRIGVFADPQLAEQAMVLNDGKPIKTKLNWILLQGQTVAVWAYNMGSSALATTVPVLLINGHANLFPK